MKNNKQFAVIGLGRFGRAVVETLVASGYDVMGCDKNMEAVKQMEHIATDVMQLDVMNEDAMQYIGLNNFDVVIVAIGESLEASIMATMYANQKGFKTYILQSASSFITSNCITSVAICSICFTASHIFVATHNIIATSYKGFNYGTPKTAKTYNCKLFIIFHIILPNP